MLKIDVKSVPDRQGSSYPAPFHEKCSARIRQALGDAGGLSQFGVNLLKLPPGAWSSQRHWHSDEDEFVYVLAGELALVADEGETTLRAGDCAAFPRNTANGHHLVNRSNAPAACLEIGTRSPDDLVSYADIDMRFDRKVGQFTHKDGTLYPKNRER